MRIYLGWVEPLAGSTSAKGNILLSFNTEYEDVHT